jgi:hypothetical protein
VSPISTIYRSDQALITVTITPSIGLDLGSWDVFEGGDNTVDDLTVLPGGMAPQVALGGIPKRSPVTVKRLWSSALIPIFKALDAQAGQAAVTVGYTVLSTSKEPAYPAVSYTGILGTVTRPNYDAMKSEAAYLQISVALNGELS